MSETFSEGQLRVDDTDDWTKRLYILLRPVDLLDPHSDQTTRFWEVMIITGHFAGQTLRWPEWSMSKDSIVVEAQDG